MILKKHIFVILILAELSGARKSISLLWRDSHRSLTSWKGKTSLFLTEKKKKKITWNKKYRKGTRTNIKERIHHNQMLERLLKCRPLGSLGRNKKSPLSVREARPMAATMWLKAQGFTDSFLAFRAWPMMYPFRADVSLPIRWVP